MFDVITIGAATADIFIRSPSILESSRLFSLKRSTKGEITQALISSGGGATNAATTFTRLGLKSAPLCLVGSDPLAEYIKNDLKKETIDLDLVRSLPRENTDFSVIIVGSDGSRSILTNRGSSRLESKYIPWEKLSARWLYLTSLEGNLPLLEEIIGFAHENNLKIALNPGNRELKLRRQLLPLLKYVDFLLLNRQEAQLLLNLRHTHSEFIDKLRQICPLVAVTNGRRGARIITPFDSYFSPILNIHPVDETGAGDAFGSAFVAALLYQKSLPEALTWAIHNSASVVSQFGAKTGILTLKKITHASQT